jgi:GrpB-like predicted nucleotidyltransferase (UPF0157 family)
MIVVVPYDPRWTDEFDAERTVLEDVLAPWLDGGIHHVGSTAIPGMSAKPVIDMIAGVRNLDEAKAAYQPLEGLAYIHTPHRPGIAHHFSKPSAEPSETTHNLHLTEPGSDLWRERLAFRDILRDDAALATEYDELKRRLASEHADLGPYTVAKRDFVTRVLATVGLAPGAR